jgi:hypothetical protein
MRIFLIVLGSILLLSGFMFLLTFILIFVFKIPGAFSSDAFDFNIAYLPDFLNYLVSPSMYPWIIVLGSIVVILPLFALIYWGVRMIIWFKANDGIPSLVMLIVWVLSLTTLVLLLFNEGVSFAENSKATTTIPLSNPGDTIYITSTGRLSGLITDKTLPFNTEGYSLMINEEKQELYITPDLDIEFSENEPSGITIKKESFGSSEIIAFNRAKDIIYNYSSKGDSIILDDIFIIPSGRRWAGDNIVITINLPEGTYIKTDSGVEKLLNCNNNYYSDENHYPLEKRDGLSIWQMTRDGLVPVVRSSENPK